MTAQAPENKGTLYFYYWLGVWDANGARERAMQYLKLDPGEFEAGLAERGTWPTWIHPGDPHVAQVGAFAPSWIHPPTAPDKPADIPTWIHPPTAPDKSGDVPAWIHPPTAPDKPADVPAWIHPPAAGNATMALAGAVNGSNTLDISTLANKSDYVIEMMPYRGKPGGEAAWIDTDEGRAWRKGALNWVLGYSTVDIPR